MGVTLQPGVRYRMPVSFGPAVGPRQHPEGRPWRPEETGTMRAEWMKIGYRTHADRLAAVLPPGCELRGEPVVAVSCAWFHDLYWLAGRGYGILSVDVPVTYRGATETIDGAVALAMWEGQPEAIVTGREELGFPKLFADFEAIAWDRAAGRASCAAGWMEHRFFEIELHGLTEDPDPPRRLPGSGGGPQLYYKYLPRTGPGGVGGADAAYVTTAAPPGGAGLRAQNIAFDGFEFRRWTGGGSVRWHRATFAQLPILHPVVNAMAGLEVLEVLDAELVTFSGPGIAVASDAMRPVAS